MWGSQVLYMLPIYNIHEMDMALNTCYALEIGIRYWESLSVRTMDINVV